jgi:hypothetical protein
MEASKQSWKDTILEGLRRIEEFEIRKQLERKMMVECVTNEEYDLYLMSESNLKKMDAETEELWAGIKVNRERWKIERAIHKEKMV